ncbi:MAG: hypothetical protein LQ344_007335 [Seirophora lacunosa]|nr:MAG: hypothetical protein LQ344_007335 [Seirophora lacunosa]
MSIFTHSPSFRLIQLLLCCLTIYTHQARAATVTFANLRTPDVPPAFQICKTGRDPDVCCEPLDIDANDGRGYGWFRADTVAFSYIDAPRTVTTVFGQRDPRPCGSDVIATRQGDRHWSIDIPRQTGGSGAAGSAAVLRHLTSSVPKRKLPETIVIGAVRYEYWFEGPRGVYTYLDDEGNPVSARPLVRPQLTPSLGARPPPVA